MVCSDTHAPLEHLQLRTSESGLSTLLLMHYALRMI